MANLVILPSSKEKLYKMLLLLFPNFKFVKLRSRDNMIIFREKGLFSKSYKTSLMEILLYYVPNTISFLRWGNRDYTPSTIAKLVEILNNQVIADDTHRIEACINYLYSEFMTTRIVNFYKNANEVIIPLENGQLKYTKNTSEPTVNNRNVGQIEEAKIVKGSSFSFSKGSSIQFIKMASFRARSIAAGLILSLYLNYRVVLTALPAGNIVERLLDFTQSHFVAYHQFPLTVIQNSS